MPTVLLLAGRGELAQAIAQALEARGYQVVTVSEPQAGARAVLSLKLDAAVLATEATGGALEPLVRLLWARSLPILYLAGPEERWLPEALPLRPHLDGVVVRPCSGEEVVRALAQLLSLGADADVLPLGPAYLHRPSREVRGP